MIELEPQQQKKAETLYFAAKKSLSKMTRLPKNSHRNDQRKIRRKFIKSSKEHNDFFDWFFETLKKLGFYNSQKRDIWAEDKKVSEFLGVCQSTVRFWRLRNGFFPKEETFYRLLELERINSLNFKETKKIIRERRNENSVRI